MRMIARRLVVQGRVQGVFYRNWTVATARALGIAGWVRNRRSGEVEILACGEPDSVDAFIERCRSGPPAASVSGIDVEEAEPEPLARFEKRPTA
jgi:acylphosphatase